VPDVLVDTSVWSLALRHRNSAQANPIVRELEELIRDTRVCIIGPIRQEILSGIKDHKQFELLKNRLRAFPDLDLDEEDFERAAEIFNRCRATGIQGSNTDFLICAAAERHDLSIFTTDQDFARYKKYCPILLHEPSKEK
jgi:predicted nucleic acid-binding protein